ncbi:MAG: N-acetylglucosamine-6-phosphate deacetylase [Oscillospiraceae bacterium]|nr:N-acetylglucosamine-6-phosphate deacetylase [Oscillospiraceae bacterium]
MLFTNALVFFAERGFAPASFRVEGGVFAEFLPPDTSEPGAIELGGARVIPGLIDLHTHGNSGADFSDGEDAPLRTMAAFLARNGVTGFAPTSMTLPYAQLKRAFTSARRLHEEAPEGLSRVLGIHMEGPFFSEKKRGAQNAAYLKEPDLDAFLELYEDCGGLIRIVDLAPELPGAAAFAREASKRCTVSAAHTDADYAQAAAFFDVGARHVTHLYNAMTPLHHREPGVIGAAAERDDVFAELICDGLHVHPSAVRLAFRLFPERICLISDALRCCGMPDGTYTLGGQAVTLSGGEARLSDGTLAGSAVTLYDCLRRAIAFGIPADTAIRAATLNPARQLGCADRFGSIAPGKAADFLVCDENLNIQDVCLGGESLDIKGT